jgi:hypothetical protein
VAKAHVLDTSGGLTRVAYHIDVPAGTNTVGTSWSAVLINSGIGGTTVLPDGAGTGGTISVTEKTAITAGTVYEVVDRVSIPAGLNTAQANAYLDALHAAKTVEVQSQIQSRTGMFGFTRT